MTTAHVTIRVSEVQINGRHRAVDPAKVADLAASIAEVGLLNPITVAPDYTLAAGRHRLEAHRSLGLAEIAAVVVPFDDAELAQIDENLMRRDLDPLEQGEHLVRREEILKARGLRAPAHRPDKGATVAPLSKTADIARRAGLSERTTQERAQIARAIVPDVRDSIRGTDVARSTRQLLDIARMPEEKQRQVVDLVTNGHARDVKDAERQIVTDRRRREAEGRVAATADASMAAPFTPAFYHDDVLDALARIADGTVDLIVADPPYNIGKAEWDKRPPAEYLMWCAKWVRECARILKPTGAMYVFGYPRGLAALVPLLEAVLVYRDWIVWDTIMGTGGGLWVNRHEDILYFSHGQEVYEDADAVRLERHEEHVREYRGVEYRFKNPSNIWRFPRVDDSAADRTNHPTQKPLAMIERIVLASSPAGGLVVDPFVGSGTTCVAAMRQGRRLGRPQWALVERAMATGAGIREGRAA